MFNWSAEQQLPILKILGRVILTIGVPFGKPPTHLHVLTRYFHHISNRIFPFESPIWKLFLFHFHVAHCLALTENFLGWCIWICTILIILKNCLPWRKHLQRLLKRMCWLHATMYMCTPRLSEPWLSGNSHRPTCTSGVETNLRT